MTTELQMEPRHQAMTREILRRCFPGREVWAFGSRVSGRAKRYSDLDLVVMGDEPPPEEQVMAAKDDFEESNLPFQVDLLVWASTSETFRGIIRQCYLVLQPGPAEPER